MSGAAAPDLSDWEWEDAGTDDAAVSGPSPADPRATVVLFGWTGCTKNALRKYAHIWRGLNCATLSCVTAVHEATCKMLSIFFVVQAVVTSRSCGCPHARRRRWTSCATRSFRAQLARSFFIFSRERLPFPFRASVATGACLQPRTRRPSAY